MKVLEYKHHAPYDGCYWAYEYIPYAEDEAGFLTAYNVSLDVKWPYKQSPLEILHNGLLELDYEPGDYDWSWQYDSFRVYEWDENLHKELPTNYIPTFALFAREHDLEFTWVCDDCHQKITDEIPFEMSGYCGDGGIGITADGWLCDSCVCDQRQREEDEEEERRLEALRLEREKYGEPEPEEPYHVPDNQMYLWADPPGSAW